MPRFFFTVISGKNLLDDLEGSDLPSLDRAIEEALKDARALMSEAILQGRDISEGCIIIRNRQQEVLKVVRFADALDRKE
ncbi:hypothetical protein G6L26_025905 (plasmid) [Agrobacterium radiobacter]|uniref:DUF6894 domain-containing protein n=1 Tax=Agrobacterium tumefaciens str. B6 TaxID=1183423 RepID=A0A822VBM2_AGRTU|nr:hypothetical protein [Agrobacterium tumefaciens]AYM09194.1 hypothetical protein At1D1460_49530 [Agrobacterium tumefaciens]KWT81399.1 hypothetical protein ASB65_16670 [Agrobacterium tumefaciens str. B6]MQB27590.1 hypothetical protein [Agrobacterium tumefaciens]NSZ33353.1 hypothetical protein [Agrobacterium tumefaciens]NTA05910.1 hypothetical protein [Agrobacterium tumefaciens]